MQVLLFCYFLIFINMRKGKHLRIRISTHQLQELMSTIIKNDVTSMSEFVRQAIKEKIEKLKTNGHKKNK